MGEAFFFSFNFNIYVDLVSIKYGLYINYNFKILIVLISCFTLLSASKISGTVTNKDTDAPLFGANVFLLEVALDKPTDMGGASDIDGYFSICDIPSGRYILVCF